MELKCFNVAETSALFRCSNCTFMELKYSLVIGRQKWEYSSNCTFMELKLSIERKNR